MSVIDEALKKTQSALHETTQANDNVNHVTTVDPIFIRSRKKHIITVDFVTLRTLSLIIVIVLFIVVFCFRHLLVNVFLDDVSFYRHVFYRTPRVIQPMLVVSPTIPQPLIANIALSLNGTMTVNEQRVALINHQLYQTGQMIDGLKIKQIHYNSVILENPITHEKQILTPALT